MGSRAFLIKAIMLVLVLAILAYAAWSFTTSWRPSRDQYPVQGISVSEANGDIAWHVLKATGTDFAYILATKGEKYRDSKFAENIAQARKVDIRYGAVHQYSLCRLASDQASNFVTTVPRSRNALPPAVRLAFEPDCNDHPARSAVLSELNTFLNQIEAHSEKTAIIAVTKDFDEFYKISSGVNRTFWLEENFFPPDYAAKPWVMWKSTSHLRVKGIEGPVDWNVVRP